jgi:hypothetical protein
MSMNTNSSDAQRTVSGTVRLPAATPWPFVFAFGIALLFTGLITSLSISILGIVFFLVGAVGWFRDVLPHERHVDVVFREEIHPVATSRQRVERLAIAPEVPRALLPLETYPISAGVKGGLAGSIAMAVLACLYGVLRQHSLWYPINLLAATLYTQHMMLTQSSLNSFHLTSFLLASLIHLVTSLLVGLLYGAMLPMFPRHPIFLGGVLAPVLWTGLLHAIIDLVNPLLASRVDWWWFAASQFAFGIVAGIVVMRQQRVRIKQRIPFAVRAGIETSSTMGERKREEPR